MATSMADALAKQAKRRALADPAAFVIGHETARLDAWQNEVTGIGTSYDKTFYNSFAPSRLLADPEISAIYHGDDLAAKMIDIVPDEMLRKGFTVDVGDPKANTEIADQIEALDLFDKIADALRWGRCFGGGALLLGADDGRAASQPLIPEKAQQLAYVYVLDRRYLWPLTYYRTTGHPKLGTPETYLVTSPSPQTDTPVAIVHESRLVRFGGATTGLTERNTNSGWDFSILQRATQVLSNFHLGWNAVSMLLADGNQAVWTVADLANQIAAGNEDYLKNRMRAMDQARSVARAVVLDAGAPGDKLNPQPAETFTRQVFPMSGIPDTLEKLCVRLAATADTPVTRLFGISPAGLNATGESDIRGWYDRMGSAQIRKVAPAVRYIVQVMRRTKSAQLADTKKPDSKISVKFPSLWSEAPQAAATTRKITLEGDKTAIEAGMLLPERAALKRFQPDGFESEIQLDESEKKAYEASLKGELDGMSPDEAGGEGGEDIQKTVLNGSQIASLVDIVAQVSTKAIPRDAAVQTIALSFQVTTQQAEKLLGSAGTPKFEPAAPEPTGGPFGGKPFGGASKPPEGTPPPPPPAKKSKPEEETA